MRDRPKATNLVIMLIPGYYRKKTRNIRQKNPRLLVGMIMLQKKRANIQSLKTRNSFKAEKRSFHNGFQCVEDLQ